MITHETEVETYDLFNEDPQNEVFLCHSPIIPLTILLLICLVYSGPVYCTDNFVPLQNIIVEHMKLSELQYNAITSFYSVSNIFLLVISGVIIDKVGYTFCTTFFAFLCFIGQCLFCLGVFNNNYTLLMFGRIIFGFGSESLQVSTNKYVINWFFGSSLTLAFSVVLSAVRIAGFLNVFYSFKIYESLAARFIKLPSLTILALVFSVSVLISFICFLISIFLWLLHRKYHKYFSESRSESYEANDTCGLNNIRNFTSTYWIMLIFVFISYLPFSSYNSISQLYYQLKFGYLASTSNTILSVNLLVSVLISPIFGYIVGKIGVEIIWVTIGVWFLMIAHGVFALTFISPYFLLIVKTIGSCMIYCGYWPVIKYLSPESSSALAYGILLSVQNLALSISPVILALILSHFGYFVLESFIITCLSVTLIVCFILYIIDQVYTHGILSMTTNEKIEFMNRELFTVLESPQSSN